MSSVPLTWPELHDRLQARNDEEPRSLATSVVERIKKRVPQTPIGRLLLGADEILSRVAILVGPEPCRTVFAAQAPFYASALDDAAQPGAPGASAAIQLTLLSYGNVARCIGDSVAPLDEQAMAERLVGGRSALSEIDQETLAAACLAVGLPARAMEVLDHSAPPAFKPGAKFDSNVAGLVDYLCAALASGAAEQDVQPAWQAMHAVFPHKLAAKTIKWSTLLWLARVVFGRIGGRPDGEIAATVRAMSSRA